MLGQNHLALLKGALQIHILNLVAQVHSLLHQSDNAPFDFHVHDGALLNGFMESTRGRDGKSLATGKKEKVSMEALRGRKHPISLFDSRQGRVGRQVDRVDGEEMG